MRYLPKSDSERKAMLADIGRRNIGELFDSIPKEFLLTEPLAMRPALSEPEILDYFRARAAENAAGHIRLLGAGCYDHHRPVLIDSIISRGEFLTAYTPYQAEIAQGTLQALFEFQTMICQLTGQEVANASMYDGSTALAEAALMALRIGRSRTRIVVAESVHPEYREVLATYCRGQKIDIITVPWNSSGRVDMKALASAIGGNDENDGNTAAVAVQSPNFFGCIEEIEMIAEAAHSAGALLITAITEPVSLGLLTPPVEADIVAMEAQPLGLPVSYGGPYAGVLATKQRYVRQMPGRLAGQTVDADGKRGFVLTLSAREQHIRREKATSNICTNQALCALAVTVFLTTYGKAGLRKLAEQNIAKAAYLASALTGIKGVERAFDGPFFNEFTVRVNQSPAKIQRALASEGIVAGVAPSRWFKGQKGQDDLLVLCATETNSREQLDRAVAAFRKVMES